VSVLRQPAADAQKLWLELVVVVRLLVLVVVVAVVLVLGTIL
jgi:hypothetical protein